MDVLADPGSVSRGEDQAGIRKAARDHERRRLFLESCGMELSIVPLPSCRVYITPSPQHAV